MKHVLIWSVLTREYGVGSTCRVRQECRRDGAELGLHMCYNMREWLGGIVVGSSLINLDLMRD